MKNITKFLLVFIFIFSFVLVGCDKSKEPDNKEEQKEPVEQKDPEEQKDPVIEEKEYYKFYNGEELISEVEKTTDEVPYPELTCENGYYYEWIALEEANSYKAELKEFNVIYNYFLNESTDPFQSFNLKFSAGEPTVDISEFLTEAVKDYSWDKPEPIYAPDDHLYIYYYTLNLVYKTFTVKFMDEDNNILDSQTVIYGEDAIAPTLEDEYKWTPSDFTNITSNLIVKGKKLGIEYNISFYDGDKLLDLELKTYKSGHETVLPTYEKDGYAFVGWFISSISLYPYTKIFSDSTGDIKLYARFVETGSGKELVLPEATYNFVTINKNLHSDGVHYVYQPKFPEGPKSSVTLYNWSTSDTSIATVSAYSSITAKKAGYCVLTATLISDPTVKINCVIKVTSEGVFYSTVEEANSISLCTVTFLDKDDNVISTQTVQKGGSAILPIPPTYDGLAFNGWDKVNYNITEDTTIKATYVEGVNNYVGKKLAIIGDSISTYQDYIPAGYSCFYPYPTADVNDVNHTWWMQVANKLGAGLFINNSYSGSCASADTGSSASSNQTRLNKLVVGSETPDVIIIYMGSNDCASKYVTLEEFSNGYELMLQRVKKLCPNAEIILLTLPGSGLYSEEARIEYNGVITDFGTEFGYKVIDLAEISIADVLCDSAHPYKRGMDKIANFLVKELLK